jgi:hypothetical protein
LKWPGSPDVWLLLDSRTTGGDTISKRYKRCFIVDQTDIFQRLSYLQFEGFSSSYHTHLPLLDFYLSHPEYDFYWFIEYDVRYSGNWESLLRAFEKFDSDFITSHIRRFKDEPEWYWWDTFHNPSKRIPKNQYVRSINVIFRISNRALDYINKAQKNGWMGHNEVSLPTLLLHNGYTIMDFGGDGEFVPPGLKNKVYTSNSLKNGVLNPFCTLRYRPSCSRVGLISNKIYHPIKPRPMMEPLVEKYRYMRIWITDFIQFHLLSRT